MTIALILHEVEKIDLFTQAQLTRQLIRQLVDYRSRLNLTETYS